MGVENADWFWIVVICSGILVVLNGRNGEKNIYSSFPESEGPAVFSRGRVRCMNRSIPSVVLQDLSSVCGST